MNVSEILAPQRTLCCIKASSKKRALERLAELIASAESDLGASEVFEALIGRERLGSTGLGQGVALPHGRIGHNGPTLGAFIRASQGVDYDAADQKPVDLMFGLLVPKESTDEHLEILARLAEMFRDEAFVARLRGAKDDTALYELLAGWKPGE